MTGYLRVLSGIILLALVLPIHITGAAAEMQADLNVSKGVISTGPSAISDEVTWVITLRNDGPANATNITLKENITQLWGLGNITAVASRGLYNNTTHVWRIAELKNASSATLTITTDFTSAGVKTNGITITALNETDPVPGNNQAEATVQYNISGGTRKDEPLSAKVEIRPTTLNLNSRGVFTAFVSLRGMEITNGGDDSRKPRIDYANSSLVCSEAEMIRASVSGRDGGTLIAQFHTYDLQNVTRGDRVKITCSGTLAVNDKIVSIEGSDTIRVTGEKKALDTLLWRLWKFLGILPGDIEINESHDGNVTMTIVLDPDNFKSPGQAGKILRTRDAGSGTAAVNATALAGQIRADKEKMVKNNGSENKIREREADDEPEKGNNGLTKRENGNPGRSNGKKNP